MTFRWCPPGKFMMGSPESEPSRNGDEGQVLVTLKRGFWLGETTVTQRQWRHVLGTQPWPTTRFVQAGDDFPAVHVCHSGEDSAVEFCECLTALERQAGWLPAGWVYRLPTEAEWEYACRAGAESAYAFGADPESLGDYAWFKDNALQVNEPFAHPVGAKRPNAWGLRDMHGNVWEWCRDCYDAKLRGGTDPERLNRATYRVLRGGSYGYGPPCCRSACRGADSPDCRLNYLGFRVTLSQSPRSAGLCSICLSVIARLRSWG